jgi:hypothetical protein
MKNNYPEVTAEMVKRNRIKQLKENAKLRAQIWQPEINDTVAGEVVCERYLLIKDENGHIVRFNSDMDKPPFFDDKGVCVAQAGDFMAITSKGSGKYQLIIEKRDPLAWWWNIARDDFDMQRAIHDIARYGGSMVAGISTAQAIEYAARQQTAVAR